VSLTFHGALFRRVGRGTSVGTAFEGEVTMNIDEEKIDRTVLALLHLTLHEKNRAWKSFDWDVMDRLHRKGYIFDPVNKAKSVALTDEGLRESERLFTELFEKRQ
jgi:hypothetical protein